MKITIVWSMNLPDLSKWIYFLVDFFFFYIDLLKYVPVDLHFAMIFIWDCSFIKCKLLYCNKSWFKPLRYESQLLHKSRKGGHWEIYVLYMWPFLRAKPGPPLPPPHHTHTHTLCINTDQHLHKLSIYWKGIIIFPNHVLIQNLQASIRVEGDGPWPKLW